MAVVPRVDVDAPAPVPWRYGLFSTAAVLTSEGRWQIGGVQYQGDNCADGAIWEGGRCQPPGQPHTVTVTLAATGDGNPSHAGAQATVDSGRVRRLTVTVGTNPAALVTTGAAATPVGPVRLDQRAITVDLTADTAGAVTAAATVDTGPARALTVKVGDHPAANVTTGAGPTAVGNVTPDGTSYPVTVTDTETGKYANGAITVTAEAGGTAQVLLTVGVATTFPVTVKDTATGAAKTGQLAVGADGVGSTEIVLDLADPPTKVIPDGLPVTESDDPFTVYAGVACNVVGFDRPEDRARLRLQLVEQRLVEQRFWHRQLATADAVNVNPGGPVDLVTAVGLLEAALAAHYGGTGTIHAPRAVAAHAARYGLIVRDGAVLRTVLDTLWAFGAGYPGTGPDGTAPPAGQVWLYGSGQVVIRRGDINVPAGIRSGGFDPPTNRAVVLAERTYVLTRDCGLFAVLVTLAPAPEGTRAS